MHKSTKIGVLAGIAIIAAAINIVMPSIKSEAMIVTEFENELQDRSTNADVTILSEDGFEHGTELIVQDTKSNMEFATIYQQFPENIVASVLPLKISAESRTGNLPEDIQFQITTEKEIPQDTSLYTENPNTGKWEKIPYKISKTRTKNIITFKHTCFGMFIFAKIQDL